MENAYWLAVALIGITVNIPQLVRLARTKSSGSVSEWTYLILFFV
jgi:uncharacterized protein with PQ loop repeat